MGLFKSTKKENNLAPVLDANKKRCLSGKQILDNVAGDHINALKQLISVPSEIYQAVYEDMLFKLAELCQAQAINNKGSDYSLLAGQLALANAVLKVRRGLMLPPNGQVETIAEQEPIWTFAFFSASLLFQLTRIQQDRCITLFQDEKKLGLWQPIMGRLGECNQTYLLEWQTPSTLPDEFLLGAFIKQLIPVKALQWLTSQPELFKCWWQTLIGHNDNVIAETIYRVAIDMGYPILISKPSSSIMTNDKIKQEQEATTQQEKATEMIEPVSDSEHTLTALLEWLVAKDKIENSTDITAKRVIFKIPQGLFINHGAFEEFAADKLDWQNHFEVIDDIKSYLFQEKDGFNVSFRSKNFEDRRFVEGIIIADQYLTVPFQQLELTKDFISSTAI